MEFELFPFINFHSQATPTRVTLSAMEMCMFIPLHVRDGALIADRPTAQLRPPVL